MTEQTQISVTGRDYQVAARDSVIKEFKGGTESTLVVIPTGGGKTRVACLVSEAALALDRKTLFIAHYDSLIRQASKAYRQCGFQVSIEMAEQRVDSYFGNQPEVVVGSLQTLQGNRLSSWDPKSFGLIIVDEAHHSTADSYSKVLNHFKGAWVLGITATPDRGDRKNLGRIYKTLAYEYKLSDAIRDGWLVKPVRRVCETKVSLENIKTTGGDYSLGDIAERIGPHVEALTKVAMNVIGSRKTVCFLPDVGSAQATADAFKKLGRRAEWIAGAPRMSRKEQERILSEYEAGDLDLITSCDKLIEGWDDPATSAVVIMRPTRKRNRYAQMIGRGVRPFPGKSDVLVVDFAWKTTSEHELITTVDLFDDSDLDKELIETVKKLEKEKSKLPGTTLSMFDLLDEARSLRARATELKIKMSNNNPVYKVFDSSFRGIGDVLGIKLRSDVHYEENGRIGDASDKQKAFLYQLGVTQTEGMTRSGASKIIDAMIKRRTHGMGTPKQVNFAISLGMDAKAARTTTAKDLSKIIDTLLKNKQQAKGNK